MAQLLAPLVSIHLVVLPFTHDPHLKSVLRNVSDMKPDLLNVEKLLNL